MRVRRCHGRAAVLAAAWMILAGGHAAFGQPADTHETRERFLATARVVAARPVATGVTGTMRVTLDDGTRRHDASVQRIDQAKASFRGSRGREYGFRDTWKFNLAAYHLARLIDLDGVPVTVERTYRGSRGSFTWWVDDVLMDEGSRQKKAITPPDVRRWEHQVSTMRVFDALIANTDRNTGNLLFDAQWTAWLIDHTRAFRRSHELFDPALLVRCDRRLLEAVRALDETTLRERLGRWLTGEEIGAIVARRDAIVAHFAALPSALYTYVP